MTNKAQKLELTWLGKVNDLSEKGHILTTPQDAIKEPYVLEILKYIMKN
ncbi:MAG TPA: hypothetical protein ACFYEK_08530 [Candidatus Wunengus sp. YC60]